MQEHVNEKTVALSIRATKLTGRLLASAMREFLRKARQPHKEKTIRETGKQSLKTLSKQGASLANIEVSGDDIGTFKRSARKYNVDFALKKDNSQTPPNWIVFFKAKDAQSIDAAFKEYSRTALKHKEKKPSMLAKIAEYKEIAKNAAEPVKNRNIGGHEL